MDFELANSLSVYTADFAPFENHWQLFLSDNHLRMGLSFDQMLKIEIYTSILNRARLMKNFSSRFMDLSDTRQLKDWRCIGFHLFQLNRIMTPHYSHCCASFSIFQLPFVNSFMSSGQFFVYCLVWALRSDCFWKLEEWGRNCLWVVTFVTTEDGFLLKTVDGYCVFHRENIM